MLHYRKYYEVIGYAYDADLHCLNCAEHRFGDKVNNLDFEAEDSEGNPVSPVFLGSEDSDSAYCGDCFEKLDN